MKIIEQINMLTETVAKQQDRIELLETLLDEANEQIADLQDELNNV